MKCEQVLATFDGVAYRIKPENVIEWARSIQNGMNAAVATQKYGKQIKGRVLSILDWSSEDASTYIDYYCTDDVHRTRKGYFKP